MASSLFIALHIVLFCVLSIMVIRLRWKFKASLGDGGQDELKRAMRAHGNLAENLPPFALIIFLLDYLKFRYDLVFFYGLAFFIVRCIHAIGIYKKSTYLRVTGMTRTLSLLLAGSIVLILHYF